MVAPASRRLSRPQSIHMDGAVTCGNNAQQGWRGQDALATAAGTAALRKPNTPTALSSPGTDRRSGAGWHFPDPGGRPRTHPSPPPGAPARPDARTSDRRCGRRSRRRNPSSSCLHRRPAPDSSCCTEAAMVSQSNGFRQRRSINSALTPCSRSSFCTACKALRHDRPVSNHGQIGSRLHHLGFAERHHVIRPRIRRAPVGLAIEPLVLEETKPDRRNGSRYAASPPHPKHSKETPPACREYE